MNKIVTPQTWVPPKHKPQPLTTRASLTKGATPLSRRTSDTSTPQRKQVVSTTVKVKPKHPSGLTLTHTKPSRAERKLTKQEVLKSKSTWTTRENPSRQLHKTCKTKKRSKETKKGGGISKPAEYKVTYCYYTGKDTCKMSRKERRSPSNDA